MDKEGMRGLRILKIRMNIQKSFYKNFQCITIHQIKYKEMQTDGLQNRSPSVKNRSLYQQSGRHFNENRNSRKASAEPFEIEEHGVENRKPAFCAISCRFLLKFPLKDKTD